MSQVSQNICKTSPSFSKSVGGNAAPSYVVLSTNWVVCSHCLPHLLLLSISHLSCCLRPGGTAVPPPAHTGGPAAAAAAAAAAKRRWVQRAQTWLCNHISDKHSSGFACFNPFATNYIVYIADKLFFANTDGGLKSSMFHLVLINACIIWKCFKYIIYSRMKSALIFVNVTPDYFH